MSQFFHTRGAPTQEGKSANPCGPDHSNGRRVSLAAPAPAGGPGCTSSRRFPLFCRVADVVVAIPRYSLVCSGEVVFLLGACRAATLRPMGGV